MSEIDQGFSWKRRFALAFAAIVIAAAIAVAVAVSGSSSPSPTPSPRSQPRGFVASIFQDDQLLLYSPTPTVVRTLNTLRSLGVDQLRVTVLWAAIAPAGTATTRPAGFDATNPEGYGPAAWIPYDRITRLAAARGIRVDFKSPARGRYGRTPRARRPITPTTTGRGPRLRPVRAGGGRYSGHYTPPGSTTPLSRVSFWSIWNEPNQPGWLSPQWRTPRGGATMEAPVLYRATSTRPSRRSPGPATGLRPTRSCRRPRARGQRGDPREDWPIPPLPFLRALYCLGPTYRPLAGAPRLRWPVPVRRSESFVAANPALFKATGFAHHPYSFFLARHQPGRPALRSAVRSEPAGAHDRLDLPGLRRPPALPDLSDRVRVRDQAQSTPGPAPARSVRRTSTRRSTWPGVIRGWRRCPSSCSVDSPPEPELPASDPVGYWSTRSRPGLIYATAAQAVVLLLWPADLRSRTPSSNRGGRCSCGRCFEALRSAAPSEPRSSGNRPAGVPSARSRPSPPAARL